MQLLLKRVARPINRLTMQKKSTSDKVEAKRIQVGAFECPGRVHGK